MGYKAVCTDCRKSLNRVINFGLQREYPCSVCGKPMTLLSHLFKSPQKNDLTRWGTVKYLVENGFRYQHIYETVEKRNGVIVSYTGYVPYPDNLKAAIEFVEKYKEQLPEHIAKKAGR